MANHAPNMLISRRKKAERLIINITFYCNLSAIEKVVSKFVISDSENLTVK